MPISITPTLSTHAGYLDDVRDQISNLLRYVIMNPGWTSSIWESDLISFRNMSSRLEFNRNTLASRLGDKIQTTLNKKFQDYTCSCQFSAQDVVEDTNDGRFSVSFDIFITKKNNSGIDGEQYSQEPALIAGDIVVNPKNQDITLRYDRTPDHVDI